MSDNTTQQDLKLPRGDDIPFNFTFTDTNHTPINVTGWTLYFTVKKNKTDTDAQSVLAETYTSYLSATSTSFKSATYGIISIIIPHTSTALLLGAYYYDFRVKTDTDLVLTITSGVITFTQDESQRAHT